MKIILTNQEKWIIRGFVLLMFATLIIIGYFMTDWEEVEYHQQHAMDGCCLSTPSYTLWITMYYAGAIGIVIYSVWQIAINVFLEGLTKK